MTTLASGNYQKIRQRVTVTGMLLSPVLK